METFDRLLIIALALLFLIVGCMIHIDKRTTRINSVQNTVRINHALRMINDVINVAQDLQIKEALENMKFGEDALVEGDESDKHDILEAIDLKEAVISDCLVEARRSLLDVLIELK